MEKNYDNFNWINYKNKYQDLNHIKTKDEAWTHWDNYGKNENREFFYINDDSENNQDIDDEKLTTLKENFKNILILKKNFDWIKYINDNKDLGSILDKSQAWHHWILHGRRENRVLQISDNVIINNTEVHNGRFGNLFFVNMVLHFISKNYNLKTTYKYYDRFSNLGIDLFIGNNTYEENTYLTEINYFDLITKKSNFTNIIVTNNSWFQNYEFCLYLEIYFNKQNIKNKIIRKNIYSNRYNNNNDLFIHIRLGDITNNFSVCPIYFEKIIESTPCDNIFIASDSPTHDICVNLCSKYPNCSIVYYNEVESIHFGSTCKHVALSTGTFSCIIGYFSFFSNVYYPEQDKNKMWHGDIFVIPTWKKIDYL